MCGSPFKFYCYNRIKTDKTFQMNRLRNEELTKTLQRIAATLKTEQDKAMRIKNRLSNGDNLQIALKKEIFNSGPDTTNMQLLDKDDVEVCKGCQKKNAII